MSVDPARTKSFEPAKYLDDPQVQRELIADALETGDASFIANALGTVARARGMGTVARQAGVTREALYKALSSEGDPKLSTFVGVLRALGITLSAVAAPPQEIAG